MDVLRFRRRPLLSRNFQLQFRIQIPARPLKRVQPETDCSFAAEIRVKTGQA